MEKGIGGYYIDRYGLEEGARRMAEDGYTHLDLNLSDTESEYYEAKEEYFFTVVSRLKKALNSHGIRVSQVHGPWRFPPRDESEDDRAERFGKMTKAAAIAKFFGAKYLIVHPLMPFGVDTFEKEDELYEINKRFFTALADVVGKLGVTVCLENMPFREFPLSSSESILKLINDINSPYLKFCLDTGHSNYYGESIKESVKKVGCELLTTVHVHDNFGDTDAHLPPYDGNIDWGEFAEALFEVGYSGVMNLETAPSKTSGFENMTDEEIRALEKNIAKVASLLAGE